MSRIAPLEPLAVPLDGTHLIEASAGTGKTYTITTLYLRLLLERRLTIDQILIVTYTNAATAELRARIRRRLGEAVAAFERGGAEGDATLDAIVRARPDSARADADWLTLALHGFDEAAISTIHGFCQRVLQEHAFESGASFDTELISNQTALLDEVVRDFWVQHLHDAPRPLVVKARQLLSISNLPFLAARASSQPYLTILPEVSNDSLEAALARHREACQAARAIWLDEREEICLLLASPDLHQSVRTGTAKTIALLEVLFGTEGAACDSKESLASLARFTSTKLARTTYKGRTTPVHPFFDACETLYAAEQQLQRDLIDRLVGLRLEFVAYVRTELARRKEEAKKLFFDDLLHQVHGALRGDGGAALARRIRARYPAALIDEFQDTDPVQYEIFSSVYGGGGRSLFLIGDPKQSIYAFRGADVFSYIQASAEAEARHTLAVNHRSDPSLLGAINTLFRRERPFFYDEIGYQDMHAPETRGDRLGGSAAGSAPMQILLLRRADAKPINKEDARVRIARAVAGEITRFLNSRALIDGNEVRPSDIAVLCRTNAEAIRVQVELRRLGVPSVLQGDQSVFLAPEAEELERVLRALAEPGDTRALVAALSTVMLGLDSEAVARLQTDSGGWDTWVGRFQRWNEVWLEWGFIPAFRRMLDECEVQQRLLGLRDGERRLTNLLHLGELLQTESVENRRRPLALVEFLSQMRVDVLARADLVGEAAQIRLESDASALKLTTIHKSKGLQYPVVYCPFLFDGSLLRENDLEFLKFHDRADGDRPKLDVGEPKAQAHARFAGDEALSENLRLIYVALTRARHRCTVVWGGVNKSQGAALGYLLHQQPGSDSARALAAATATRINTLTDQDMRRDVEKIAAASGGTIEVADLFEGAAPALAAEATGAVELDPRRFERGLDQTWRTSSFSGLIVHRGLSLRQQDGVDRDEDVLALDDPAAAVPAVILAELPAGARMGTIIHSILEELDFFGADEARIREVVAATLRRQGIEEKWVAPLGGALAEVLSTPLASAEAAPRLADLRRGDRLDEMEFLFPVGREEIGASGRSRLTREGLARVFARHAGPASRAEYIARLRELGFKELWGYLRGYIDLVFRHGGRWYVVDYKSNRLGARPEDYRPARLAGAMEEHHYFLQYHLYTVALHRHLRLRLPGYDCERDLGGVYYLFVRGMSPRYPSGNGVFFDRPQAVLIEELSALLDG